MELLVALGLVVVGLALLTGGGEALVRGATAIAEMFGLTPAVIGLTIVAMGTSLPEMVVSVLAGLRGQPDIAMGNVVGSNIFNVAIALGVTALVHPLPVHGNAVKLEWPFMFLASCLALLLARDGSVDRMEGLFFVVSLVLFMGYMVRLARQETTAEERTELADSVAEHRLPSRGRRLLLAGGAIAVGVALLMGGGHLLVDGAVRLARLAGLTERVIGLTVVAVGTSAPELATSVIAALRRHTGIAVGNIIGSNIFNILGILGVSALVQPLVVSPALVRTDLWWMLGTSFLIYPLMRTGRRIGRREGAVLVSVYVVYTVLLLR